MCIGVEWYNGYPPTKILTYPRTKKIPSPCNAPNSSTAKLMIVLPNRTPRSDLVAMFIKCVNTARTTSPSYSSPSRLQLKLVS